MLKKYIIPFILIFLIFAGVFTGCKEKSVEKIDVTGISINTPQNPNFAPGVKLILFTTIQPSNATNTNLVWTSANKDVAQVNEKGEVLGIAKGKTTITVTTEQGQFKDSVEVTVLPGFCTMWYIKDKLTLPLSPKGKYDFTVYWGDGTKEHYTTFDAKHTYAKKGTYLVRIIGICEGFGFTGRQPMDPKKRHPSINYDNIDNLLDITQWGNVKLHNYGGQFAGCSRLIINATDVPDISNVTNMKSMFGSCSIFNSDLSGWDVSNVKDMSEMFTFARKFNQDLSNWDVSNVETMYHMFENAEKFNGDISGWDTSNVTNMQGMFHGASVFNRDISKWDTSKVTTMNAMFAMAHAFNQDISKWNTSNVTRMSSMFYGASVFNQDISKWDTSKVESMNSMFCSAGRFNQDISEWDTSNVGDMDMMFKRARSFNQDISKWNMSKVDVTAYMFAGAISFNQDISGWDVSDVGNMDGMFGNAISFNQDISKWDVSNVYTINKMFYNAASFTNGGNPEGLNRWNLRADCTKKNVFEECSMRPLPHWAY